MFNDSKYTQWYFNLVKDRQQRNSVDGYCERHHIIPRSLGGNNEQSNIVTLTAREHYICHLLLTKMCVSKQHQVKMNWALHRMAFSTPILNSHEYELARKRWSVFLQTYHQNKSEEEKKLFAQTMQERMLKLWENDIIRREQTRKRMLLQREQNPQKWRSISINNLPRGDDCRGANNHWCKPIEYNGNTYFGWRELQEATGVTKHLYRKYYTKGINPEFRIGTDGPIPKQQEEVSQYASRVIN